MPELVMSPAPASRLVRHVGDCLTFTLRGVPPGWTAKLRTNVGRAAMLRDEIVRARFERLPLAGASWRDLVMTDAGQGEFTLTLPLAEVGHFKAKAYALDERGHQHWPGGADFGVSVHPAWTRTGNTIYCAFPRQFGPNKTKRITADAALDDRMRPFDQEGYTVIPPGGKLRDLIRELPHITGTLGCRILHLLPVSPVPTTFARFGRFGSPYALQDLTAIDPALVDFDKKSTGVEQFCELAYATHAAGAKLMLDLVINHTGWGSTLYEQHPEWFVRHGDGTFESPGAWGTVWEDLVELDQRHVALWEQFAEAFLTWCRRGVDAFRCDAGYKIPLPVWQFITARVRQEFPDTVFLLEGLGGSWEATNDLLGEGGMQWAYSELFQNFGGQGVQWYLDHALATSLTAGTLIHYSETHDNARLAARPPGRLWSLHRNLLSALTGISGGFGFTNGVEWLATEQVNVHSSRGLAWGSEDNLLTELGTVNRLLAGHPCFFDGAKLTRLSPDASPVYVLRRDSAEGTDAVLVLVNTDCEQARALRLELRLWSDFCGTGHDLLRPGQPAPLIFTGPASDSWVEVELAAGAVHCLSSQAQPRGLAGEAYRRQRALADWAIAAAHLGSQPPATGDWKALAAEVDRDPAGFLAQTLGAAEGYRPVVTWSPADRTRVTLVPPGHWLLVRDTAPFHARLTGAGEFTENVEAVAVHDGFIACLRPRQPQASTDARLELERYGATEPHLAGNLRFLAPQPAAATAGPQPAPHLVLLTNGRGAMARLHVDLGRVTSKYDCLLGANLSASIPVDRHIFAKRIRVWVNADGFISPLNFDNLIDFEAGPPAHWRFVANAGDGRSVEIHLVADLLPDRNTVVLQFSRPNRARVDARFGRPLPDDAKVSLTARVDIEDRNFHWETKRNGGSEYHFSAHCRQISTLAAEEGQPSFNGFEFTPAADRQLRVWVDAGHYHHQSEWLMNLPHPVEAGRGQEGAGDAYSPGWFELPLAKDTTSTLVVSAEAALADAAEIGQFVAVRAGLQQRAVSRAALPPNDTFGRALVLGTQAYVVKRDDTRSVIAGYPWFLDWGRDSLICARGLIAAGMFEEVRDLLITFGRFEKDGTLPNSIHGADASNRDTTDAPLWFGVVAEELAEASKPAISKSVISNASGGADSPVAASLNTGSLITDPLAPTLFSTPVDSSGRPLRDVLRSIACGYLRGTPNGIRVDAASGLVWSPGHFTWMDTNHPAGTPREGYPVEIQALWVRLLRLLARLGADPWEGRGESWADLARRTERSLHDYFWLEECGWYADVLLANSGTPARTAPPSNALRSNCLLLVALNVDQHPQFAERARRMVAAAARHLVIPGALRSLAPLPVIPPLAIYGNQGGLLNDPDHPYWPSYEGDEDTRRKPAYHNGTAWTWTFPAFCEALVKAHPGDSQALAAARAYLGSIDRLLAEGCLGHLPEILDGDAPHAHRGCDAQAWGSTEALRVWRWLAQESPAKQV
jgi:starch synthase (maltosyl-transferring)